MEIEAFSYLFDQFLSNLIVKPSLKEQIDYIPFPV